MSDVEWGVRVGSSVVIMADGPTAFREEGQLLARGVRAQVCLSAPDTDRWVLVGWDSTVRPGPLPPQGPRRLPWWDRLGRGGYWVGWLASRWPQKPEWFGRRRV